MLPPLGVPIKKESEVKATKKRGRQSTKAAGNEDSSGALAVPPKAQVHGAGGQVRERS